MNNRTEQYIWITFGNETKNEPINYCKKNSNVMMGLGYHINPKTRELESNYYCSSNSVESDWVADKYAFNPLVAHKIKLTVGEDGYIVWVDGERQIVYPLPENYKGGYVGIGTGYTSTEIRNLRINLKKEEPNSCTYFTNCQNEGFEMPVSSFYEKGKDVYKRIFNGSGSFISNIPIMFFEDKMETFELEFDLFFAESIEENAPASKEFEDPFRTYSFGPYPLQLFSEWKQYDDVYETILHKDSFEIKTKSPEWDQKERSLFISCPNVGGIRISSEAPKNADASYVGDTAIFEPEYSLAIDKADFNNELIGTDGTKVKIICKTGYWGLEIYNAQNQLIHTINKWNLSRSDDRFVTRQYSLELPLNSDEIIFGTGERYNHFNQHGLRMCFWNTDMCYQGYTSLDTHELWRSYKNVPVVNSNKGITYFFNTTCYGEGDFGYTDKTRTRISFDDSRVDFYVWTGTPVENMVKYTDLTGKPVLPPKWAFRYQAGGSNGFWGLGQNRGKEYPREITRTMIEKFSEMGTLPSAIYMEGGGADDKVCYDMCNEKDIKVMQWNCGDFWPEFVHENYPDKDYKEMPMVKNIYNPDEVHYFGDFTHKDALSVLKKIHGERIRWGLRGGMVDFTELVPIDTKFDNGLMGNRMHNFWVWWYAKAYHDLYTEMTGGDYLCYVRGACAGSQKWNCTWTGDQMNSFDGLKQQIVGGLSLSASGFSIWGTDMGGLSEKPEDEVYIRAYQFCTFMPIMRTGGDATKLPWDYGEKVQEVFKKFYWLRENLLDMIYSYAIYSHKTGIPMTQAMALAFPECKEAAGNEEQYVFCDNILFASVFEKADTKNVYFPAGRWYSLFNDEVIEGEGYQKVAAPLDYSPAYLRDGAVIPVTLGASLKLMEDMLENRYKGILIAPPEIERSSQIYKDENTKLVMISKRITDQMFTVEITGENDFEVAVILAEAKEVSVNGQIIGKKADIISENEGYVVQDGRTYVKNSGTEIKVIQVVTQ